MKAKEPTYTMRILILNHKYEPMGKAAGYCIMRGHSPLANPYPVKPWGPYERGETLPLYDQWLRNKYYVERDIQVVFIINKLYREWVRTGELRLVCCCKPLACHGDIIANLLTEILIDNLQ